MIWIVIALVALAALVALMIKLGVVKIDVRITRQSVPSTPSNIE